MPAWGSAAHGQTAARRFGGFDGEQPLLAFLAKAHGDTLAMQVEIRRVVIGVEQAYFLRRDIGQQGMTGQFLRRLRAELQL